ncbi:hypothetical protein F3Y22_tig00009840pilonHSYRG00059 [Hibiscus syriacus]|uniref:Uncharacterized protein n=1 Tax=Hibiscus syriacus TaxID=106335 RepID=A0A6A3C7X1_HIBSY|nr:hypothetical protein F3Y22_tig00009840pilonHSYRG00059 [Hibiscus syriacus]
MSDELDASGVHTNKDLLDDGNVGRNKVETEDSCPYRQDNNRKSEVLERMILILETRIEALGRALEMDLFHQFATVHREEALPSAGKESSSSKGVLQLLVKIADCVLIANEVIDDISKSNKAAVLFKGWEGKFLYFAGMITLIRSVLSNLPVYYMSLFPIPKSIADAINKVIASFVWKGDGAKIEFWTDHWTDMFSLKSSFPRIFSLTLKKYGKIVEFGKWENGVWEWKIDLRRELFEWEKVLWSEFLLVLLRAVSLAPVQDRLHWEGADNGRYTLKSFCSKCIKDCRFLQSWKSEECSALVFLFVLSAIELPKLLIMYCVNATASGRFGNGGAWCGKLVLYFLAMLMIYCKFGFLKGLKRNSGIFGILASSIGVWAYSNWPSLIQSVQDFVHCPESLVIGNC